MRSKTTKVRLKNCPATKWRCLTATITLGLSRELGARNIRVNSIAPGYIQTEGSADLELTPEMIEQVVGMTPLGRPGQPEDVAKIAVFLASDDAEFVTGERIMASGGWR